jgi:hypothetical protein
MLGALLTLLILGLLGVVVVGVLLAILSFVVSVTFGIVGFLLFKVAPVLFLGWLVVKVVERSRSRRAIGRPDQKWLDG